MRLSYEYYKAHGGKGGHTPLYQLGLDFGSKVIRYKTIQEESKQRKTKTKLTNQLKLTETKLNNRE